MYFKSILFSFIAFSLYLTITPPKSKLISPKSFEQLAQDSVYRLIPAPKKTWGYDILIKNKILVHQAQIPGVPGVLGFSKKNDADKVAKLVLSKVKKGIIPPTVTIKELDSLKIKK